MLACGALCGADIDLGDAQVDILHKVHIIYVESSVDLATRYNTLKYGGPAHLNINVVVKGKY